MLKVCLLAGGLGSRLMEETVVKRKPMVEIGGRPILWHIMNIYAAYGFKEVVLALGYKWGPDTGVFAELSSLEQQLDSIFA